MDCVNEPHNQTKENIKPIHSIRKLNNADYVRIVMNRDQLIEFRKSALKIFENNTGCSVCFEICLTRNCN